jgi:hypothetical protein
MTQVIYKNRTIQFREPTDINELESIFKLRHSVYSEDPLLNNMVKPSSLIDVSNFDLNALHFAAFDGRKPVASIRIISQFPTHFTLWIQKIIADNHLKLEDYMVQFPLLMYYPDLNWSLKFIADLKGTKIGEVGRLAIHKDFRKGGIVLDNLIRSFIEYCIKGQLFNTGFGLCTPLLERYYLKFGFSRVQEVIPFVHGDLPEAVVVRFDHFNNRKN